MAIQSFGLGSNFKRAKLKKKSRKLHPPKIAIFSYYQQQTEPHYPDSTKQVLLQWKGEELSFYPAVSSLAQTGLANMSAGRYFSLQRNTPTDLAIN